jgi:hypothetical protein
MWLPVPIVMRPKWRAIFNQSKEILDVTGACPVCGDSTLHRWYASDQPAHRIFRGEEFAASGRLWEWCSTCDSFEYYPDGFVPAWWAPPFVLDIPPGARTPEPIETRRKEHLQAR